MPPVEQGAIFLDRDGLLNELVYYESSREWESPRTAADLRLIPGALEVVAELAVRGWRLFLVSNQPSYAKGKTTMEDLQAVHQALVANLGRIDVSLHESYYCFHHPNGVVPSLMGVCPCRKPSPHFLRLAARDHAVNLRTSWMIGDQDMDIFCGQNAGCSTIQIAYPPSAAKRGRSLPTHTCDDFREILDFIR